MESSGIYPATARAAALPSLFFKFKLVKSFPNDPQEALGAPFPLAQAEGEHLQ